MPLEVQTHEAQTKLADFCRSNVYQPIPGIIESRIDTYRSLVFNTVEDTLRRAYPITARALGSDRWSAFVNAFFSQYRSTSPELWRMPYGLYRFAQQSRWAERVSWPFLYDLLLFEWIEIEVYMMPDGDVPAIREMGDMWQERLVINPDHKLLKLSYPVFSVPPEAIVPEAKGEYFLLCFRHRESLDVHFIEISPEFERFFSLVAHGTITAKTAHARLLKDNRFDSKDKFLIPRIRGFLEALRREGMIHGWQA